MAEDSVMQSRWKELEEVHASLKGTASQPIDPEIWHRVISQTLSASSACDDTKCHLSPDVCQHCHQLVALSAVTTMTLLVKGKGDREMEDKYLQSVLCCDLLSCLVNLLHHRCQFLRYQARKALTSVFTLSCVTETSVQYVTEMCVWAILMRATDSILPIEPLQLLCCVLSRRSASPLRVQMSVSLLPHLPSLYKHCCSTVIGLSAKVTCGNQSMKDKAANDSVLTVSCLQDGYRVRDIPRQTALTSSIKRTSHGDMGDPPCKQTRIQSTQEDFQSACSVVPGDQTVTDVRRKYICEVECEGSQSTVRSSSGHSACTQAIYHSPDDQNTCRDDDNYIKRMVPSEKLNVSSLKVDCIKIDSRFSKNSLIQQQTDVSCSKVVKDSADFGFSHHNFHVFSQTEMLHYVFLCLMQKIAKLTNSFVPVERVKEVQSLNDAVLIQLVTDHAALFNNSFSRQSEDCLLLERKFLDVLDTVMDYTQLRTGKKIDHVYEDIATHFVHCMHMNDCSWWFPIQDTLIGGCFDKSRRVKEDSDICHPVHRPRNEVEGGQIDGNEDKDCCPVLVLLVAVVLKSCAVIFKSAGEQIGDGRKACIALLHSMHNHLCKEYSEQSDTEEKATGSSTSLTWLPQVCGEQDDRWIEALVCLLDIFICLQTSTESDDVKKLKVLLDPHMLFIQLLHLTHYNASLLIDWLTSPETCFLAYLTQYLRYLAANFPACVQAVSSWSPPGGLESDTLDGGKGQVKNEKRVEMPLPSRHAHTVVTKFQSSAPSSEEQAMHTIQPVEKVVDMSLYGRYGHSPMTQFGSSYPLSEGQAQNILPKKLCVSGASRVYFEGELSLVDSVSKLSEQEQGGMNSQSNASTKVPCSLTDSDNGKESSLGLALLSCYDNADSSDDVDDDTDLVDFQQDRFRESVATSEEQKIDTVDTSKQRVCHESEGKLTRQSINPDTCNIDDDDGDGNEGKEEEEEEEEEDDDDDDDGDDDDDISNEHDSEEDESETSDSTPNVSLVKHGREKTTEDCGTDRIDRVMHLLMAVRMKLGKLDRGGLLVYNPAPLINLLSQCYHLYHSVRK